MACFRAIWGHFVLFGDAEDSPWGRWVAVLWGALCPLGTWGHEVMGTFWATWGLSGQTKTDFRAIWGYFVLFRDSEDTP